MFFTILLNFTINILFLFSFIFMINPLVLCRGVGGLGGWGSQLGGVWVGVVPIPAVIGSEAGLHPGQVASPSKGHTKTTETDSYPQYSPFRFRLMIYPNTCDFGLGRKPEHPKKTHMYTERALHEERFHTQSRD